MTDTRTRVWSILAILFVLSLAVQSCSDQYAGASIEGQVVDAESGKPLGGVVVVSVWQVSEGNLAGTNDGGQIQIQEAVTDSNGRYFFPAWGPLPFPQKKNGWWVDQYISATEPGIIYFKGDYGFTTLSNDITVSRVSGFVGRSKWNGKTIPLERIDTRAERVKMLQDADSYLYFAFDVDDETCAWRRIPAMLTAVLRETEEFTKRNRPELPNEFSGMLDRETMLINRHCGSLRASSGGFR
ncbi:MAG TPA: hypothetical protein VGD30_01140 [Telluria sp.]